MLRVRRIAAERAALIDQWRDSGLSLPAYCARRGLHAKTMSGWVFKPAHRAAIDAARGAASPAVEARGEHNPFTPEPSFLPVRAGITQACKEERQHGHSRTAALQADDIRRLKAERLSHSEIARRLGIGRTSVRCMLAAW
jgi:DNA-directed RNA polymerase specialized sigma24 family protein